VLESEIARFNQEINDWQNEGAKKMHHASDLQTNILQGFAQKGGWHHHEMENWNTMQALHEQYVRKNSQPAVKKNQQSC
jgi:hypothetical protein